MMAIVLSLDKEVMQTMCVYWPQSGRLDIGNVHFYDKIASEWDLIRSSEITFSLRNFDVYVGNVLSILITRMESERQM